MKLYHFILSVKTKFYFLFLININKQQNNSPNKVTSLTKLFNINIFFNFYLNETFAIIRFFNSKNNNINLKQVAIAQKSTIKKLN